MDGFDDVFFSKIGRQFWLFLILSVARPSPFLSGVINYRNVVIKVFTDFSISVNKYNVLCFHFQVLACKITKYQEFSP